MATPPMSAATASDAGLESFTDDFLLDALTERGIEPEEVAERTRYSLGTVRQFFNGSYRSTKFSSALRTEFLLPKAGEPDEVRCERTGRFVETATVRQMLPFFKWAQDYPGIAIIEGDGGLGKSSVCEYVSKTFRGTDYVSFRPSQGSLNACIRAIGEALSLPAYGSTHDIGTMICEHLRRDFEQSTLLILDESQHLCLQALDELRCIHDKARCGLVYVGNTTVFRRISGRSKARRSEFSQLHSRVGRRLTLKGVNPDDAEEIAKTLYSIHREPELKLVRSIAQNSGSLRKVCYILV